MGCGNGSGVLACGGGVNGSLNEQRQPLDPLLRIKYDGQLLYQLAGDDDNRLFPRTSFAAYDSSTPGTYPYNQWL